mmetsp:Transcript_17728/g.2904  ORF Transcript_17728/g.2904 Transcript_17728/m.2904 type:complete len:92 (-) Transcript_17728:1267-1542(-)
MSEFTYAIPDSLSSTKLKKGDYIVHIYIEDGREFLSEKDANTIDAMVVVNCFNKDKATTKKSNIGSTSAVYWGEHLYFETKNADHGIIESE